MKKKRVLKSWVKETLLFIVLGLALIGCAKLLQLQDKRVYELAVERCGSVENIKPYYTQQGDKFYACKVEK